MGGNKALQLSVVVLPGDRPREFIKDKFITLNHRVLKIIEGFVAWRGDENQQTPWIYLQLEILRKR